MLSKSWGAASGVHGFELSRVRSEDLLGEVNGVKSKGVSEWLLSRILKLERLDDGLVVDRDGVNLT